MATEQEYLTRLMSLSGLGGDAVKKADRKIKSTQKRKMPKVDENNEFVHELESEKAIRLKNFDLIPESTVLDEFHDDVFPMKSRRVCLKSGTETFLKVMEANDEIVIYNDITREKKNFKEGDVALQYVDKLVTSLYENDGSRKSFDPTGECPLGLDDPMDADTMVALTESPAQPLGRIDRVSWTKSGEPRYLVKHADKRLVEFDRWYDDSMIVPLDENVATQPKYYDTEFMINDLAGGMHRPKKQYRFFKPGDNPMAAEQQHKRSAKPKPKPKVTKKKTDDAGKSKTVPPRPPISESHRQDDDWLDWDFLDK